MEREYQKATSKIKSLESTIEESKLEREKALQTERDISQTLRDEMEEVAQLQEQLSSRLARLTEENSVLETKVLLSFILSLDDLIQARIKFFSLPLPNSLSPLFDMIR